MVKNYLQIPAIYIARTTAIVSRPLWFLYVQGGNLFSMNADFIVRIMADWIMFPTVLIGGYVLVFRIPKEHRFQTYSRILLAGLTAYLFAKLIGSIYQPETLRPFEIAGTAAKASFLDNPGFPSDHILFVTALTCAVWFETKQKLITWVMVALIVIVGMGRIFALVHTPIDVIGGAVIALMGSLWYLNPVE